MISRMQRDGLSDRPQIALEESNRACISSKRSRNGFSGGAGFRKCARAASTTMLLPTPGRSVAASSCS